MTVPGFMRFLTIALAALTVLMVGGKGAGTLVVVQAGVAIGLALSALLMPGIARLRPTTDLLLLVVPLLAIPVVQLCWPSIHPLLAGQIEDGSGWTLDRSATAHRLRWLMVVTGFAVLVHLWWRGSRASNLLRWLSVVAALHALLALIIGPAVQDWPSENAYVARIRGTFVYPNQAAVYWASALPMALWIAIRERRGLWWVGASLLLIALVLSASRGGIIAATVFVVPYLWYLLPRGRRWAIAPLALIGLAAWLSMLGLDPVLERFERLDSDAETLNGRSIIWQAALSQVPEHGALGAGVGNAHLAYLRSGNDHFEPARVEHMHSDLVELLVDYGWLGAGLVLLGWLALLWRRFGEMASRRGIRRAALIGLGIMALHGLADHLQESQAINLIGVAMLVALLQHRRKEQAVRSTWAVRILAAGLALLLLWQLPGMYQAEKEHRQARIGVRWMASRLQDDRPLQYGRIADGLRATEQPLTSAAAIMAMRWWNTLGETQGQADASERSLALYQHALAQAPGSVRLQLEAARAHRLNQDYAAMWACLKRVQEMAPGWRHGQLTTLYCGLESPERVADDPILTDLVERMLQIDVVWPRWFAESAVAVIGKDALLEGLEQAATGPLVACRRWLARYGDENLWRRAWAESGGRRSIDIRQWPLQANLNSDLKLRYDKADYLDHVAKAQLCFDAGIPLPPELRALLLDQVEPIPHWAEPVRLRDDEWRQAAIERLIPWLHVKVAHDRWRFLMHSNEVFKDPGRLALDDDPRLVAAVVAEVGERDVAWVDGVLSKWRHPRWSAGGWGRSAWLWIDAETPRWMRQEKEFVGILVDGEWRGWYRGFLDLTALCGDTEGMHSVVLLRHPDQRD